MDRKAFGGRLRLDHDVLSLAAKYATGKAEKRIYIFFSEKKLQH